MWIVEGGEWLWDVRRVMVAGNVRTVLVRAILPVVRVIAGCVGVMGGARIAMVGDNR
jgi:hypothetical protein